MRNPVKVIMCPDCEQKFRNKSVIYWFDHAGIQWSDGYRSNDIAHEIPLITRCDECYCYFWLAPVNKPINIKSKMVRLEMYPSDMSSVKLRPLRKLTPLEYAEALAFKKYNGPEEERYLRIQLWWAINDFHRRNEPEALTPELTSLFEENLETLIFKSAPDVIEHTIELAEMHRELGQFTEAEKYLNQIKKDDSRALLLNMRRRIDNKDRKVFMV